MYIVTLFTTHNLTARKRGSPKHGVLHFSVDATDFLKLHIYLRNVQTPSPKIIYLL